MFLNGLKTKSIIRKLKKAIASRSYTPSRKPIRRIGILQEGNVPFDVKKIKLLTTALGIKEKDVEVLSYIPKLSKDQKNDSDVYSESGIGWNATLKTIALKDFVARDFDILLSYYTEDRLPLQLISGLSRATFKVGLMKEEQSLHDLVITTAMGEESIFITELEKYLRILKIL